MPIDSHTTLDALTEKHPHARRLLGRLGMDIQTEGALTLLEASTRHGLSLHEVLRGLEAITLAPVAPRDWLQEPRAELVTHLVAHHHTYAREELARLGPLIQETLMSHGPDHPELAQVNIHFRELNRDLLTHFKMEENTLFPAIVAMDTGAAPPPSLSTPGEHFKSMEAEHQAVEELFTNIRSLTRDYTLPEQAPTSLRALYLGLRDLEDDLHIHIYLENHLLFPRALPAN